MAIVFAGVALGKEVAFALCLLVLIMLHPLRAVEVKGVLTRLWPILLMLAIALLMTLIDLNGTLDSRAILRISFYYIRIPVFLMLGFAARKYMRRHTTLLWMLLLLGMFTSSTTLNTYFASDLSGLNRNSVRQIIGGGDPVSVFVPIVARILWSRALSGWQLLVLLLAVALSLASIVITDSRTGILIVVLSFVLSLPGIQPLRWARLGVLAILIGGFIVTTPVFPEILDVLSIDPASLGGFNEVIAGPRYDFSTINIEWRGHETYMAFLAAQADGLIPLLLGHGLSASADLGISIELAPDQFFTSIDIFHNGYSFIVLHSGLLGIVLYMTQMWLLARPQAALRPDYAETRGRNEEDLLYVLTLFSLAASTAVIAGMFNASTFSQLHLFLLGCFYPLRARGVAGAPVRGVPIPRPTARAGESRRLPIAR